MIKTLQEILSTANHEDSLVIPGIGDAYLERCTINGAAREAEFHLRGYHGEASAYRMTDLRWSRVVSRGKSAIVDDIYMFPLRDRAESRGAPPAASLDVLFDGDSNWRRSETRLKNSGRKTWTRIVSKSVPVTPSQSAT